MVGGSSSGSACTATEDMANAPRASKTPTTARTGLVRLMACRLTWFSEAGRRLRFALGYGRAAAARPRLLWNPQDITLKGSHWFNTMNAETKEPYFFIPWEMSPAKRSCSLWRSAGSTGTGSFSSSSRTRPLSTAASAAERPHLAATSSALQSTICRKPKSAMALSKISISLFKKPPPTWRRPAARRPPRRSPH